MKIVAIDPFYLRMPRITRAADGTQDTLLVRVRADSGLEGWGECDASPLVSLSAYCCPMSHGNIVGIRDSLLGETIDSPEDVRRVHAKVLRNGADIGQIHHAYSAADIALWDLLGRHRGEPVFRLLGGKRSFPKVPYASVLFGDTPDETRRLAAQIRAEGFRAGKFGWGPIGKKDADWDLALVASAREGLGPEAELMVDAGWCWGRDVETVCDRVGRFAPHRVTWLEEPLEPEALREYGELARRRLAIPIAGGENASTLRAAEDYLENGKVDFIQIDAGRIGGITSARKVLELARETRAVYVNHTFKSRLSLAAALHVFADVESFRHLEYPVRGSALAQELASADLLRDPEGRVRLSEAPGLGVRINPDCIRKFNVPVRIDLSHQVVFDTPALPGPGPAADAPPPAGPAPHL